MVEIRGARLGPLAEEVPLRDKNIQQAIASNDIVGGEIRRDAFVTHNGVSVSADIVVFDSHAMATSYPMTTEEGPLYLENLPTLPDGRPYLIFSEGKKQYDAVASHISIYMDPSNYPLIKKKLAEQTNTASTYSAAISAQPPSTGQISGGVPGAAKYAASAQEFLNKGSKKEKDSTEDVNLMRTYGSLATHENVNVGGEAYPVMTTSDLEEELADANLQGSAGDLAEKTGYVEVKVKMVLITGVPKYVINVGGKTYHVADFPASAGSFGDPPQVTSFYVPSAFLSEHYGIELEA